SIASLTLLELLNVWRHIIAERSCGYTHMDVRVADSFGKISFNNVPLELEHLGHIAENYIISFALIKDLEQQSNATVMFDTEYQQIH
ncbi:monooxygenase, partial [Pseudoalteromonas sp. S1610]